MSDTTGTRQKKPAAAFLWLLLIPAQLIIDILLISGAAYGDVAMADPTANGHPAPALSILAFLAAVLFTVIVIIVSLILTIVRYNSLKKKMIKEDRQ
ncbi:MAG: hypothetical protein K6G42_09985 [Lachnospiraceae bacterium]|nr:hypothetical protein [Lachnospiraceae bacterium]